MIDLPHILKRDYERDGWTCTWCGLWCSDFALVWIEDSDACPARSMAHELSARAATDPPGVQMTADEFAIWLTNRPARGDEET